jgi:membrane fusion protein
LFDSLSVNQQIIAQLYDRKNEIRKRIEDETKVFESNKKSSKLNYENTRAELFQLNQQMEAQQQQLNLATTQWQKYKDLKKRNLITETELISRTNSYYSAKSTLDSTKRQILSKQNEINNMEREMEQMPFRKNKLMQELQGSITQLDERIIELEGNESYAIKASIDGRVTSVQAHPGQSVSTNSSLLTIIPNDTVLYAELFLPSRAIGFVSVGQKVLLRYDAFPYQRFGLYEGRVEQVAQAVINPSEAAIPLQTKEPVYRVKVSLSSQSVNAYGKQLALQAGMSISADIILEERSLGEWLLAPIYSLRGKI